MGLKYIIISWDCQYLMAPLIGVSHCQVTPESGEPFCENIWFRRQIRAGPTFQLRAVASSPKIIYVILSSFPETKKLNGWLPSPLQKTHILFSSD